MRFGFLSLLFCVTLSSVYGQTGKWVSYFSATGTHEVHATAVDAYGNTLFAGGFRDSITLGGKQFFSKGTLNNFLVKYNATGNMVWVNVLAGTGLVYANEIITDSAGNVFIAGDFTDTLLLTESAAPSFGQEDLFLAMFDTKGELKWSKTGGSSATDQGRTLCIDKAGAICLFANVGENSVFDHSEITNKRSTSLVLKYTITGELLSTKELNVSPDSVLEVTAGLEGSFYVSQKETVEKVEADSGACIAHTEGYHTYLFSKFSSCGKSEWQTCIESKDELIIADMLADSAGNLFVAGAYKSLNNEAAINNKSLLNCYKAFVAKFNAEGGKSWFKTVTDFSAADSSQSIAQALIIDKNGALQITGSFTGRLFIDSLQLAAGPSSTIFILSVNAGSGQVWSCKQVGGMAGILCPRRVSVMPDNGLVLVGTFTPAVEFSPLPVYSSVSSFNSFVVALDSLPVASGTQVAISDKVIVYPNTSSGRMFFELPKTGSANWQVNLLNQGGNKVFSTAVKAIHNSVGLPELPDGEYTIQIQNDRIITEQKITVANSSSY